MKIKRGINKQFVLKHKNDISNAIAKIAKQGKTNISTACKIFGVNRNWFYRHRNKEKCTVSKIGKCFRQQPNQLMTSEVETIEAIILNPENYGKTKTTLYYSALREGKIACGISTFYKYADLLGYKKINRKPKIKARVGYRAKAVFEYLHIDVTLIQTQNDGIQRVTFVKDNFSRALLHYKSTTNSADSNFIRKLLEETFDKHQLLDTKEPIHILTDGGSENKGEVLLWVDQLSAPPEVKKITAKTVEFPFSNSMSESTHSIYKTEFKRRKLSLDTTQHIKDLDSFMEYYNDKRYPIKLFGLTPTEVLNGEEPDKYRFKTAIREVKKNRLEENQHFNNCPVLCI